MTGLIDRPTALLRPRILLPAIGLRRLPARPDTPGRHSVSVISMTARLFAATLMVPTAVAIVIAGVAVALRRCLLTRSAGWG